MMWSGLFLVILIHPVSAMPNSVTLFPGSAELKEIRQVPLQALGGDRFRAIITFPGQMQPDTLRASLATTCPQRMIDQTWRQIAGQDDTRLAQLRKQLQEVKRERIALYAGLQALDGQIEFWQSQARTKSKTLQDADAFSDLLGRNLKKCFADKLFLEPQLRQMDERIRSIQEEIDRIVGLKENLWEVTFLFTGPPVSELPLTLEYILNGCGWAPLYRLDARPSSGSIHFSWDAEIWQSSGQDWNAVNLRLATLPLRPNLLPPPLTPWIIRPRQVRPLQRSRAMAERGMEAAGTDLLKNIRTTEETDEIRQATYSIWQVGRRDVPAGVRQRIRVREESWPTSFSHLLRPRKNVQSFIQGDVRLNEPKEIPTGKASFFIDGALIAKKTFRFTGQEDTLFFGNDPLVRAKERLVSQKSGERGFVSDLQTMEWKWRYEIQNERGDTIHVRLEESFPQVRDERIKLSVTYDPKPSITRSDIMIWAFELPSGGKKDIKVTVRLEAPKEMELDVGWHH